VCFGPCWAMYSPGSARSSSFSNDSPSCARATPIGRVTCPIVRRQRGRTSKPLVVLGAPYPALERTLWCASRASNVRGRCRARLQSSSQATPDPSRKFCVAFPLVRHQQTLRRALGVLAISPRFWRAHSLSCLSQTSVDQASDCDFSVRSGPVARSALNKSASTGFTR
jgi:hypothetical protein